MALRNDGDRIPELRQHLEARARELQPALYGLIRIGHAAEANPLRRPRLREKLVSKENRRVFLDEDLALKIDPRRKAEVLVIRPGIAIDTAVLAAAVRVEIDRHPGIRAVVVAQDALRGIPIDLRRSRRPVVVIIDSLRHHGEPLEAARRISGCAPAAQDNGIGHGPSLRPTW